MLSFGAVSPAEPRRNPARLPRLCLRTMADLYRGPAGGPPEWTSALSAGWSTSSPIPNLSSSRRNPTSWSEETSKPARRRPVLTIPDGFFNDGGICRPTTTGSSSGRAFPTAGRRSQSSRSGRPPRVARDIVGDHRERAAISAIPAGPPTAASSISCPSRAAAAGSMPRSSTPGRRSPWASPGRSFSPPARARLNYPMGNGFIDVAADKVIFSVDEVTGNIFLVSPISK